MMIGSSDIHRWGVEGSNSDMHLWYHWEICFCENIVTKSACLRFAVNIKDVPADYGYGTLSDSRRMLFKIEVVLIKMEALLFYSSYVVCKTTCLNSIILTKVQLHQLKFVVLSHESFLNPSLRWGRLFQPPCSQPIIIWVNWREEWMGII